MILAVSIAYAIWAWRSRDSLIITRLLNIVNGYRKRSAKTTSSYSLSFEYVRRLKSTVWNHTIIIKFGRMRRWFWQYLLHMQHEHEVVDITLSILDSQTRSMDNGIDQRKLHHCTYCLLETAGNWTWQYQIMLKNRTICRISAYEPNYTYCSERSNINALWITIELKIIQARTCIQQHIIQIPAGRLF